MKFFICPERNIYVVVNLIKIQSTGFSVGSCMNGKETSLIPTSLSPASFFFLSYLKFILENSVFY